MRNLHKIYSMALTDTQLGIANYYNTNGAKAVIFTSDGTVKVDYPMVGIKSSWAKWNNNDWIPFIKHLQPRIPLHQLRIKVSIEK